MITLSSNTYEKNKGEKKNIKRCDIQLRMHILDNQTLTSLRANVWVANFTNVRCQKLPLPSPPQDNCIRLAGWQ